MPNAYIRSIRNTKKKNYAQRYLAWRLGGEKGPEPDKRDLGSMGAQAVRLEISDRLRKTPRQRDFDRA